MWYLFFFVLYLVTKTVQDKSRLFKLLALFESDADTACKMHKRRVDALTDVVNQLNTQYYLAICKQLHYEIGKRHLVRTFKMSQRRDLL